MGKPEKIDASAELKGEGAKAFWQLVKFIFVSLIAFAVQIVTVNLFKVWLSGKIGEITGSFAVIFSEQAMGKGNTNWGYVLAFFLSNLIANIVGYFINRKKTFKSDTNLTSSLTIYFAVLLTLIVFNSWFQGVVANRMNMAAASLGNGFGTMLGKADITIAAMAAGLIQTIVLFPLEKFVLLKEKKENKTIPAEQKKAELT